MDRSPTSFASEVNFCFGLNKKSRSVWALYGTWGLVCQATVRDTEDVAAFDQSREAEVRLIVNRTLMHPRRVRERDGKTTRETNGFFSSPISARAADSFPKQQASCNAVKLFSS